MTAQTCLCGISVHKGTLIIAIVYFICSLIVVSSYMHTMLSGKQIDGYTITMQSSTTSNDKIMTKLQGVYNSYSSKSSSGTAIMCVIGSVFGFLLIYGNQCRKPGFYKPFLGLMILDIGCAALSVFGLFVFSLVAIVSPSTLELKNDEGAVYAAAYIILSAIIALMYVPHFYFYIVVVNRSRKLLIEEQKVICVEKQAVP